MPTVERTDPDGVDFGWVMQTTFVLTILLGAPLVAVLSLSTALSTWTARALFAVRVGAVVWLVTAVGVFLYARRTGAGDGDPVGESGNAKAKAEAGAESESEPTPESKPDD